MSELLFDGIVNFDESIFNWDTSRVTNMTGMMRGARSFSGNISTWNTTSSVEDMGGMFATAYSFNGDLSNWDTYPELHQWSGCLTVPLPLTVTSAMGIHRVYPAWRACFIGPDPLLGT